MLKTLRKRVALKNCNYGLFVTQLLQLSPLVVKSCAGHGFFVENHLVANTKSSFYYLQFESCNLAGNRPDFSHYFQFLC